MKDTYVTTFKNSPTKDEIQEIKKHFSQILMCESDREPHQIRTDMTHEVEYKEGRYKLTITFDGEL